MITQARLWLLSFGDPPASLANVGLMYVFIEYYMITQARLWLLSFGDPPASLAAAPAPISFPRALALEVFVVTISAV